MRNAAIIAAAVAVLVVGFVAVQGAGTETKAPPSAPAPATPTQPTAKPAAAPEIPTVVFAQGKPEGGVRKLEFQKGEEIRFRVRSDVADEIHVHGFDKHFDVVPGRTVGIRFPAEFDGAYEVEMEGAGVEIASLVVQP